MRTISEHRPALAHWSSRWCKTVRYIGIKCELPGGHCKPPGEWNFYIEHEDVRRPRPTSRHSHGAELCQEQQRRACPITAAARIID